MDWTQVLAIVGTNMILLMSMFGITISLHIHTDKKIDAIRDEIRDFHERLLDIERKK